MFNCKLLLCIPVYGNTVQHLHSSILYQNLAKEVPKKHFRNLLEMDSVNSSLLFEQVPQIARKIMKATGATGMNIINNNEEVAGQTVFHTHIHLAPRFSEKDDLKVTFVAHEPNFEELGKLAEKIAQTKE